MSKRIIAILLMLLANTIMLAHAIIPHQHNDGLPNFAEHHGKHSHADIFDLHNHNHDSTDHQPNAGNDIFSCLLKQDIFLPTSNEFKFDCECNHFSFQHTGIDIVNFTRFDLYNYFNTFRKATGPPLQIVSFYSTYVIPCQGLRAPPLM